MTEKNAKYKLIHIATHPSSLFFFLTGQVQYMKQQGLEVYGIASPGIDLEKFAEREGAIVHSVEMPRAISPLRDLISLWKLCFLLKRIRPEIVHAHTPKGGLLGMIAAFLARVPVRIYHVHGFPYLTTTGLRRFLMTSTERISCMLSQRVLFVSESVRQIAIADRICSAQKSKIINNGSINGVDALEHFNPKNRDRDKIKSALGIPANAIVIGFVGRLVIDKGLIELMTAWESLRRQFKDLFLLIIGSELEKRNAIPIEMVNRIRTDPRIRFVGKVSSPADYYASMDILVLPSYREGFGLVAIEASAMELPVVATRIPGCIDSVLEGETGLLVPPKNAVALEKALKVYIEDKDIRILHGKNGRKRALTDFKPQDIWKIMHAEYLELLKININSTNE